ncbi:MAG: SRPBCC domain-containing protein [Myxococcales bacterium]|nr:SRPBCC domain-containing protein [Myxococcales bacterium]
MQLRAEIEIAAPPDRVWQVLVGFAEYPEWNPYVTTVEGQLTEGAELTLTLTSTDGSERRQRATVVKVDAPRCLRYRTRFLMRRLFEGEHYFELGAIDGGRTRFVQGEDLSGALVQHMGPRLTAMARGFVGMNEALKKRVERG